MIVLVLEKSPPSLRGDLTKWLQEVSLGVFVGQVSARVREELWNRVCENVKTGRATLVYSAKNEQHLEFRVHNTTWEPIDFEGIRLMLRPSSSRITQKKSGLQTSKHCREFSKKRIGRKQLMPEEFMVIDLETTGVDSLHDEIIELGAIHIIAGEEVEECSILVKPSRHVPRDVAQLTGIDDKLLEQEGLELGRALRRFLLFIGQKPVVSHNVDFDCSFIQSACDQCDEDSFENERIDTLELSRKLIDGTGDYRLETLVQHLDIRIEKHHRALYDCRATLELFKKLNGFYENRVQ